MHELRISPVDVFALFLARWVATIEQSRPLDVEPSAARPCQLGVLKYRLASAAMLPSFN
jgi:hypothetical protein